MQISSWFVALVAAIENLAHEEWRADPCPACGLDRGPGPTRKFKDFVTRYAADAASRSAASELYEIRSGLVHGRSLLGMDEPPSFDPARFPVDDYESTDRLSRVVNLVMINWLRDPAPTSS